MTPAAFWTLVSGAGVTAGLSIVGIAAGLPLGLAMALIRWGRVPIAAGLVATYVSIVRATPIVTMALFVFFALPGLGIRLEPIPAAALTLALNTAAFDCEIWRSALITFPHEQLEAARAHGLTPFTTFRRIVFPQLWRSSLGPLASEMTILLKGTPAVAVIGVVEITRAASRIGADTYEPLPPFLAATAIYTALIVVIVRGQRLVERRIARRYGYDTR